MYILGALLTALRSCTMRYSPLGFFTGRMEVLQADWPGLLRPWSIRPCIAEAVPNKASQQRGCSFLLRIHAQVFDGLSRDWLLQVIPPVWAQTSGFTLRRWNCSVWGGLPSAINIIILCPLSKGTPISDLYIQEGMVF